MAKKKFIERKFSPNELKQINSKKYLSWKCTRKKVIEGNKTDFALFTLSDSFVSHHHTIGITPIVVKDKMGFSKTAVKVVVSFADKDVAKRFATVGATTVMFISEGTIDEAVSVAASFAKAQIALMWVIPEGAVRVGRVPKKHKATV